MIAAITRPVRRMERSPMATLGLVGHQFAFDLRGFGRNRQARFFTVILPVLFLVIFVGIFGNGTTRLSSGITVTMATYYVPGLTAMGIISASYANLVLSVVSQRETGILKRRRAAPVPAWVLILGRALVAVVTALCMCVLLLTLGRIVYGVSLPTHTIPAVVVVTILGAVSFCSLGFAVAAFIDGVDSAQPIVQATLLPLYFISGVFVPQSEIPSWLGTIAAIFPVRHLANGLVSAYDPGTTGSGVNGTDLAILAAWALGGLLVGFVRFSWMPRGR